MNRTRTIPSSTDSKSRASARSRPEAEEDISGTRSIRRTCGILRLIGASEGGVSLSDVAEASELPKSSAHRYLLVLEREGFVERDHLSGRYRLGMAFVALHTRHADWLVQRARPLLERVRSEWDESVNLGMLSGNGVVYLDIVESPRAARLAARRGDLDSLHATALGKAILATFSDQEVLATLQKAGMEQRTHRTITDPKLLLAELARIRAAGYAVDDQENESEGRCVAVFVPGLSMPIAISVSGLASRLSMQQVPEVARSLMRVAAELSGASLKRATPHVEKPRSARTRAPQRKSTA